MPCASPTSTRSAARPAAEEELIEAARTARDWAAGTPLLLGGDFNLRPALSPHVFARLAAEFGLHAATGDRVIDHLLVAGLEIIEATTSVGAGAPRGPRSDRRSGRKRAPDPALRPRSGRGALRDARRASRDPVVVAEAAPGRRCDISRIPTPTKGEPMASTRKKTTGTRRKPTGTKKASAAKASSSRKTTSRPQPSRAADRPDKSVEEFRNALERSVSLSRERIQEVVDDAVKRGRMTRDDANELVSKLVARSRKESKELVKELEALLEQARKGVEKRTREAQRRTTKARRRVEQETSKAQRQVKAAAGKAARGVRDATEEPLARADAARRRAGVGPSFPITGYDELTAAQIGHRLGDLSKPELRKVRTHEKNGKGRKSILDKIDKALA